MWDQLLAGFANGLDQLAHEFGDHGPLDWMLFFAPLILLEIPLVYLPIVGVVVARWLGYPRIDRVRRDTFLASGPRVSVVIAGRNEGATVESAIRSLLDQDFPVFEIIVVDDASEDDMEAVCRRYARRGLIRYVRNDAALGRGGRPAATNMGTRLANGDYVVSVDADTTFDRRMIREIVAPFADPRIGVVAGNILVRNEDVNILTQVQTLEYITSIDLSKRWAALFGRTLQASGALGGFRRSALMDIGGWDPELAEDGDISLRLVKAGWKTAFAPEAVAITEAPTELGVLVRQRSRWDRGELRTYFRKHRRAMLPSVSGLSYASGMWIEFLFAVVATLMYPVYTVWLMMQGWHLFLFVLMASTAFYTLLSILPLVCIGAITDRIKRPWSMLEAALVTPIYKAFLRWVRVRAMLFELLRIRYEDSFLPEKVWTHAPRW
jgi:biofilm PGA synthesis N-glycosyltransferase PgaC